MYDIKDVSKTEIGKLSQEELENYKNDLKELYQNEDSFFSAIETEETQNFVNKAL